MREAGYSAHARHKLSRKKNSTSRRSILGKKRNILAKKVK
jgi:hypothetical protein